MQAGRKERAEEQISQRITAINLERIWWFVLAATGLSIAYLIYNLLWFKRSEGLPVQAADVALSFFVIGLTWRIRRTSGGSAWRHFLVLLFLILMLGMMDAYYFTALAALGHNGCYVFGVMVTGVLLLLPTRVYLPVLLGNHVVYLAFLLTAHIDTAVMTAAVFDGTASVVIAGVASRLLYHTTRSNLRREQLIQERSSELAKSNTELVTLNEEMNDLMAIAAHDLRSPLQGQKNLLELLRTRTTMGREQISQIMDTAIEGCGSMLNLVSRLLEAHQAEHQRDLPLENGDLGAAFRSALDRHQLQAAAKNIRIETTLPETVALAKFDPASLDQVLDNLLSNAIKFSPLDSCVRVTLRRGEDCWLGEVQDQGPGIPAEERGGLFRKFHRGSARPTAAESSTGLGLFIVKTLLEAMGGKIGHVPTPSGGALFQFTLPAAKVTSEAVAA